MCDDAYFRGNCVVLRPGEYPSLRRMGMNDFASGLARELSGCEPRQPSADGNGGGVPAVLYEAAISPALVRDHRQQLRNLGGTGFNDRASSVRVEQGYWMFYSDADCNGECLTFGHGKSIPVPKSITAFPRHVGSGSVIRITRTQRGARGDVPFFPGSADSRRR